VRNVDRIVGIAMIVCAAVLAIAYASIKQALADSLDLPAAASAVLLGLLIVLQVVGAIRLLQRTRL
jgi:hypothetical protein